VRKVVSIFHVMIGGLFNGPGIQTSENQRSICKLNAPRFLPVRGGLKKHEPPDGWRDRMPGRSVISTANGLLERNGRLLDLVETVGRC
jgi:hypothetical protein